MTTLQHLHSSLSGSQLWLGTSSVCSMPSDDYRFEPTKVFYKDPTDV